MPWKSRVNQALRKLDYELQRKEQTVRFWSVGFYGWFWITILRRRPAKDHFFDECLQLEARLIRVERRYWYFLDRDSALPA